MRKWNPTLNPLTSVLPNSRLCDLSGIEILMDLHISGNMLLGIRQLTVASSGNEETEVQRD